MAGQTSDEDNQVLDFPFTYASETTSADFTSGRYDQFIRDQGVHGEGMWKTECIDHKRPKYGALRYDDAWVLPSESVVLECACAVPERPLVSWREYYYHRGLRLDSPAAVLLTYSLTLYYILTALFKDENRESLTVHIIGAEKEADLIPTFQELAYLLPSLRLDLVLIGPALSRRACAKLHSLNTIGVRLRKGVYHRLWSELGERPDLIVGFNAGLAAYPSWMDTIKLITNERIPAYFTDFCRESCQYTSEQIDHHCDLNAKVTKERLNPFRSPIRICDRESREPRLSNSYIYGLEAR